jgi:hypothetical protein
MLRRVLGALAVLFGVAGLVMGDETAGSIVKVEDGQITVRVGGGGFGKKTKGEEKVFKISKDVKIIRVQGKDKEEVKITPDELKTALKVTNVFATIVHDGDNATEVKLGFGGGFGFKMKGKKDTPKKSDD